MSEIYDLYKLGKITKQEFHKLWLKEHGYEREIDYRNAKAIEEGYLNYLDKLDKKAQSEGYKSFADKQKVKAQKEGFKSHPDKIAIKNGLSGNTEYVRNKRHEKGINKPMDENLNCSMWLGYVVGECVLSQAFKLAEQAKYNNPGYDWVCNRKFKIDVKAVCIEKGGNRWNFEIKSNKEADYFLLAGFDNRQDLNPLQTWLINGDARVTNNSGAFTLHDRKKLSITNTPKSMKPYERYKISQDRMDLLKAKIEEFKQKQQTKSIKY